MYSIEIDWVSRRSMNREGVSYHVILIINLEIINLESD